MAEAAPKPATYADLEAVPANLVAEIIQGALVTHPRPSPRHAVAANVLGSELTGGFQFGRGGPGGWIFMVEPELHFGANVVVPDIAGWKRERLSSLPDKAWIEIAPDWICEVISPSTEHYDRGAKRQIYGAADVAYLWLVNPVEQYLEAFQLVAGQWLLQTTVAGADEVKIPPFDAAPFSLGLLWPFDQPIDTSKPQT
ncbi:MAG: Uma2 family endonuclease [Alphaproteobacteria bacterium]|nr:Uma2 family endonuclease [Alphaproteobacteria bacterium]